MILFKKLLNRVRGLKLHFLMKKICNESITISDKINETDLIINSIENNIYLKFIKDKHSIILKINSSILLKKIDDITSSENTILQLTDEIEALRWNKNIYMTIKKNDYIIKFTIKELDLLQISLLCILSNRK